MKKKSLFFQQLIKYSFGLSIALLLCNSIVSASVVRMYNPIEQSSDDAEEFANGQMYLDSTDLELTEDSSTQKIGLRFNHMTIPQGAKILSAKINFSVDEYTSGESKLHIHGEMSADANTFATANGDISRRPLTTLSSTWLPEPWTAATGISNPIKSTPDLTSVVQEIVNQPNWKLGNSMAFIISGTGKRVAHAFDSGRSAPALSLRFFIEDPIPPTMVSPVAGTTLFETETFTWHIDDLSNVAYWYLSVINSADRSVYSSGVLPPETNHLTITEIPQDGTTVTVRLNYATKARNGHPRVTTVYPVNLSDIHPLELPIEYSSDDAEEFANGQMYLNSSDLELVEDSSTQTIGLRFVDIPVPQGAIITNAYIQFYVDESNDETTQLTIYAEDNATPTTFTSDNGNISTRSLTEAYVNWLPDIWSNTGAYNAPSTKKRTSNLRDIVQELTDKDDWKTGQAMAFILKGSGKRVAQSFDGGRAPRLHIDFKTDLVINMPEWSSPAEGTTFTGSTATFVLDANGSSIESWSLELFGPFGADTNNYYDKSPVLGADDKSIKITSLPQNGVPIKAVLNYKIRGGERRIIRKTYTAYDNGKKSIKHKLTSFINRSSDDAEEFANKQMYLTSTDLELVEDNSKQIVGIRFNPITIPPNAFIVNAYLRFRMDESNKRDTHLVFHGELSANAKTFESNDGNISSRPLTTSTYHWKPTPWRFTTLDADILGRATKYSTGNIREIVQELIEQKEWHSDQSMAFIISGEGKRVAKSFDGSLDNLKHAVRLDINYILFE